MFFPNWHCFNPLLTPFTYFLQFTIYFYILKLVIIIYNTIIIISKNFLSRIKYKKRSILHHRIISVPSPSCTIYCYWAYFWVTAHEENLNFKFVISNLFETFHFILLKQINFFILYNWAFIFVVLGR